MDLPRDDILDRRNRWLTIPWSAARYVQPAHYVRGFPETLLSTAENIWTNVLELLESPLGWADKASKVNGAPYKVRIKRTNPIRRNLAPGH